MQQSNNSNCPRANMNCGGCPIKQQQEDGFNPLNAVKIIVLILLILFNLDATAESATSSGSTLSSLYRPRKIDHTESNCKWWGKTRDLGISFCPNVLECDVEKRLKHNQELFIIIYNYLCIFINL